MLRFLLTLVTVFALLDGPAEAKGAKTVHVRGYHRKDGTYVRSHMRSPPSGRGTSVRTIGRTTGRTEYRQPIISESEPATGPQDEQQPTPMSGYRPQPPGKTVIRKLEPEPGPKPITWISQNDVVTECHLIEFVERSTLSNAPRIRVETPNGVEYSYKLENNCRVLVDGKDAKIESLPKGTKMIVIRDKYKNVVTTIEATAEKQKEAAP